MSRSIQPALMLLLAAATASADDAAPAGPPARKRAFKQGEVSVVAAQDPIETANTKVDAEALETFGKDTASSALGLVPGIDLMHNSRNEDLIYLRGSDSRQVPVFVDGVPAYVLYDGYTDFSRFTTFDLAEIQVAKGFSSVTYGPNTLGGAINLVTRKPTKALEGDARIGFFAGGGQKLAANVGTLHDAWFLQVGASGARAGAWPMSSSFVRNAREDGGDRNNSSFRDQKFSMKAGWLSPDGKGEYVLGLVRQRGEKGNPVGTDLAYAARYWQWPYWNKDSAYLTTSTALGQSGYMRFRAYFDAYENSIRDYTNATCTQINLKGSFSPTGISRYSDFTHGLMAEVGNAWGSHNLKASLQTKTDVHREDNATHTATSDWLHYQDRYTSLGVEDTLSLTPAVDLSLGVGWDKLSPVASGPTWSLPDDKTCFHGQAGVFWKVRPGLQLYATVAQKDHFPTLKDRYSQRFATFIENPGLQVERSTNYEVGTKAQPASWLEVEAALFLADIHDLIQEVKNVQGTKSQMQNIGHVRNTGVEVSVAARPGEKVQFGCSYTYLDRENLSEPATKLTSTPYSRATAYVRVAPLPEVYALASLQSQSRIWDSNTVRLAGFTTLDLTLGWQATSGLLLDAGLTNALDRNYQLTSGYPLSGRAWFADARYRF